MSILNWLSRNERPRKSEARVDLRVKEAIELAALGIDARLCLVEDYASRMLPAVECALAHSSELAALIPGPIDLIPGVWSRDANVRALFVASADIDQLLARSIELLAFAANPAHAGLDHVFAVISMMRTERKVLGWANHGEILHKDAAQCTVSFSHHRLLAPSVSEAALRREIEWRTYEHIVVEALASLSRSAGAAPAHGTVNFLLRERLQLLQQARAGLDALHQAPVMDDATFLGLRQRLIENGRELAALDRRADTLEERLARVVEALAKPAAVIRFGRIEDRLTSLNIVAGADADIAARLNLAEITMTGSENLTRATAIVRVSRRQLKPRRMDFSAAEHWLGAVGPRR